MLEEEAVGHLKHDLAQGWEAFNLYPQSWVLGQYIYGEVVQIPAR